MVQGPVLQSGWLWPYPQTLDYFWKGLPETNTLAYYEISAVKSFKVQAPDKKISPPSEVKNKKH